MVEVVMEPVAAAVGVLVEAVSSPGLVAVEILLAGVGS